MRFRFTIRSAALMLAVALLLSGCFGGGGGRRSTADARAISRYNHTLHSTFYRAWSQPDALVAPRGRISVPVDVAINEQGRVLSFRIAQPSGFSSLDNSIRAVGRQVRQVDPPPVPLVRGRFQLRINFDLDVRG